MTALRLVLATAALILPAGCGVTYISSRVSEQTAGLDVRVIPLSAETVLVANSQPYVPRSLPDVFHAGAGGGTLRGMGALPDAPVIPQLSPGTATLRPPPAVTPGPYRLGVGDVLTLTVASNQTVDQITGTTQGQAAAQDLMVRDDGAVSIPQVGVVDVAGLTVDEAESRIFERLVETGIAPNFGLQVSGFNSQRVAVGGAVGAEQVMTLDLNGATLSQALSRAGGLTVADPDFAVIRIYRDGALYEIPVAAFRDRADLQALPVLPGDALHVDLTYDIDRAQAFYASQIDVIALQRADRTAALTELETEIGLRRAALDEQRELFLSRDDLGAVERDHVYLAGEVTRQSRWPLPFGQQATLADVLYDAGGFDNETGNPAHIYVLRPAADPAAFGAVTAWHLDARGAAALTLATRFEMRPDDIIFIEEQPITRWNRAIQQSIPAFVTTVGGAAAG